MAGSYDHCCKEDGSFIEEDFHNMIENLGDAYEACEMMHWMINYLAAKASQDRPPSSSDYIKEAEEAYYKKWARGDEDV